jgi:hypothetical protein
LLQITVAIKRENEMEYIFATEKDGEEIAELLEEVEFEGEISIAYCRRPNAVTSLAKEGEKSAFVIAKDNGKIVGTGGCVIRNGVAYLTGMRARTLVDIPKSYELLRQFCRENDVRLTYTTILSDNAAVRKMLERKRKNMPYYLKYGECSVHIIRKKLRVKDRNSLKFENGFYILENFAGREIAKGKAIEQWDYKQYVVKHYGWKLRLAKKFLKWIPNENEVLKFFTLAEVSAENEVALESFLRHVSNIELQGNFFLYGGIGAKCPVKSIEYKSVVYIVDWDKNITDLDSVKFEFEVADV